MEAHFVFLLMFLIIYFHHLYYGKIAEFYAV